MRKINLDIDAILAPIAGDNPAGVDLKYDPVYDEIKEARRADEVLNMGDWQRDLKVSDWDKVIKVSAEVLTTKTKDIQIAVWLTEALIKKGGFAGLADGLKIISGILSQYWETLYPEIDEGDLDFRAAPLVFLNDKASATINEIPLTDPDSTEGYSWYKWQESRQVGYDKDTKNQYGDIDDNKKKARDEKIAEGKLTADDFDAAVAKSPVNFYAAVNDEITRCKAEYEQLDNVVEEKFAKDAPRLSEIVKAIDDNLLFASKTLKEKGGAVPAAEVVKESDPVKAKKEKIMQADAAEVPVAAEAVSQQPKQTSGGAVVIQSAAATENDSVENAVWQDALATLSASGINESLLKLLNASCSAPSKRQQNRYRLMMAKLSLNAKRPDLARPLIEELYALIDELGLEKWESPLWIAEIIDAYYRCLTAEGATEEDIARARTELFPRLCRKDITKAIAYKE